MIWVYLNQVKQENLCMYIYISSGDDSLTEIQEQIEKVRRIDVNKEISKVIKHWKKYVEDHDTLKIKPDAQII